MQFRLGKGVHLHGPHFCFVCVLPLTWVSFPLPLQVPINLRSYQWFLCFLHSGKQLSFNNVLFDLFLNLFLVFSPKGGVWVSAPFLKAYIFRDKPLSKIWSNNSGTCETIRVKLEASWRLGGKLIYYMGTCLWLAWSSAPIPIPFIGAVTFGRSVGWRCWWMPILMLLAFKYWRILQDQLWFAGCSTELIFK